MERSSSKICLLSPTQTLFLYTHPCTLLGQVTYAFRPQILLHKFRDPSAHQIAYHSGFLGRSTPFLQSSDLPVFSWMGKKNVYLRPLASFQMHTSSLLLTLQTLGNQNPPQRPRQTPLPWWWSAETQNMEYQGRKSLEFKSPPQVPFHLAGYRLWWSACTPLETCLAYMLHPHNHRYRCCRSHRWQKVVESAFLPGFHIPGRGILRLKNHQALPSHWDIKWSVHPAMKPWYLMSQMYYTFRGSVLGTHC